MYQKGFARTSRLGKHYKHNNKYERRKSKKKKKDVIVGKVLTRDVLNHFGRNTIDIHTRTFQ